MCTAEGHVLSSRTRRQASVAVVPLHLYKPWLFHSLFSIDCGLICTRAFLSLTVLRSLWIWFCIWSLCARCLSDDMTWFGMLLGSAACYWLSLSSPVGSTQESPPPLSFCLRRAASYLEHWICVNSPCPGSARCRNGKKGQNVGRQQIKKHITLQISQIIVWHEAVVRLEGFGPLHRSWKHICYSGANGRQLERFYMIWWIVWGRATEPFTVCKTGLFPHSALQNGIKKISL